MSIQNAVNIKKSQVINSLSTGILTGGILTINGGDAALFDLSSGTGYVVNSYTNPDNPTITEVAFSGGTGITVTNIATDGQSFISINSSGSVVQQTSEFDQVDKRDLITIGVLGHTNNTTITAVGPFYEFGANILSQYTDLTDSIGIINRSGNVFSANGANLNIDKSSGETFKIGSNFTTSAKSPNISQDASASAPSFLYIYQDGSGGVTVFSSSVIDPDQYDDGTGVLASVPNNKFTTQRITFFTNSDIIAIEFGQNIYNSISDAEANIQTETFISSAGLVRGAFRCWLVTKKGTTNLSLTAENKFITAGKFGNVSGGGATSTTDLQQAYDNSVTPEIVLDSTRGGLTITDATSPLGANLFEVENNAQTTTYLSVDATGAQIDGALTITTDLAVAHGGTGVSTLTGVVTGNGSGNLTANAVTEHGVIIGGSSNAVDSTTAGVINHVLTSGGPGVDPSFQVAADGGLKLLQSATASTSSTIDFEGLTSTYGSYVIVCSGIIPATDDIDFHILVGTGATPDYKTGVADYSQVVAGFVDTQTIIVGNNTDDELELNVNATNQRLGNGTNEEYYATIEIHRPADTSMLTGMNFSATYLKENGNISCCVGGGQYLSTTAVTALRFEMQSGTIASGELRLYGRVNA